MKKTLVSVGVMLAMATSVYAGGGTVTIPTDDYKAILERLDSLQKRVDTLESVPQPVAAIATDAKYKKVTQDIDTIYDTLDVLETKNVKNKINFGAELRVRVDNYTAKNYNTINMNVFGQNVMAGMQPFQALGSAITHHEKESDTNNWTNRFRINMDAQINDSLQFHGRLAMFKNWGDSDDGTSSDLLNDFNRAHRPGTSNLWVDRAYIDWIPKGSPIPLAITVGRHPSTEGPPFELRENRMRQSTYPALLFDGENDGVVVTFGLDRYTGLKEAGWRFAYGKAYHSDDDNNTGTPFPFFDDGEAGDSTMAATFFETEIPGVPKSLVVLSYAKLMDMPFYFSGPQLYQAGLPNVNLGDMDIWGVHLQANDIASSGLDLFFSYGGNKSDPNGNAPFGVFGLLSSDGQSSETGYSVYTGLRYTLPVEPLNMPRVGFEFNHGSEYWFSMTMATPDLFNKLATRGNVYDAYYIQPVNKNLFFRAGYIHVDYEYTGSGQHMGAPMDSDATLDNYYFLMDVRF
jgi:tetrahydromethanopterin S-methyltransferase subunit G